MLSPSSRYRDPNAKGSVRFWLLEGECERVGTTLTGAKVEGTPYASASEVGSVSEDGSGEGVVFCEAGLDVLGIGSAVTAKRMCSIALESCFLGCAFVDLESSVWKRGSVPSSIFAVWRIWRTEEQLKVCGSSVGFREKSYR